MLVTTERPLTALHDVAVLDLDGVVYVGPDAVPTAPTALEAAREAGMRLAFVTNNAARTPGAVAEHLRGLGVPADPEDVVTSAQAAARLVARELGHEPPHGPGSADGPEVFLIGGEGLEEALRERGLRPVTDVEPQPRAVAQGFGPQMPWRRVVDGAILVARGLPWVASNTDLTFPTAAGLGPGNGTLVDLVARHAGRDPLVAGKPEPALFEETRMRVGGEAPLVVGDRLDTDIAGAVGVGWDSLLVMTGVSALPDLASCPPDMRPTYLAADLTALMREHRGPTRGPVPDDPHESGPTFAAGGWTAVVTAGRLQVTGATAQAPDDGSADAWWRCAASACWAWLDEHGQSADVSGVRSPQVA